MKATNEVISTDNPVAVTFDTLTAAKELRKTGLDDRQSEAIVTTISKAMSETVATKADLELQGMAIRATIEALRAEMKAGDDALRAEMKASDDALRAEMKAGDDALRAEMKAGFDALSARMEADRKSLEQSMAAMQDRIVIRLGGVIVTLAFLLLAVGPFYFSWVFSMLGSSGIPAG